MPVAEQRSPAAPSWEHFPHDADVGIRGRAATVSQAFEQAALALTAVITDPARVRPVQCVGIRRQSGDPALLLYDWLNALVYEMGTRRMLFGRFEVHIADGVLVAEAWGEPVDTGRHEPAVEVKGATMTELDVRVDDTGNWLAQCVVDV